VLLQFPINGFLGTGAPFAADLNLVVQLLMAGALVMGALLAKQRRYKAHGICQTAVLLLNLLMIGLVMMPSLRRQVNPAFHKILHNRYYAIATLHAVLGTTAELLGIYIVILADTNLLPQRLRIRPWKLLMRTELVFWLLVLISGIGTYYTWYIVPFR